MTDPTEAPRREMQAELSAAAGPRETLEARYGQVWNTEELSRDFVVLGFQAPLIVVTRKADKIKGSMMFQATPRFFFGFEPA